MTASDALWADFDEARALARFEDPGNSAESGDDGDDGDDEFGDPASAIALRSRVCRLPDGDVHVCDDSCPYTVPGLDHNGRANGDMVCIYTGLVIRRCCETRTDFSTGRSTWCSDPDVNGNGSYGSKWRKKRDMKKESENARTSATTMDDAAMPEAIEAPKTARSGFKRGALCVDEEAPVDTGPKRIRVCKKDVASSTTRAVLNDEALTTFSKLLGNGSSGCSAGTTGKKVDSKPQVDARLLDFDVLFNAALKRYLKKTASDGTRPCFDDLHNLALAVQAVIADEKLKLAKADENKADAGFSVTGIGFRQRAANLAVAIWSGACVTPYLSKARRGADSFRPFAVGVFYAFKRGLVLSDGTVLVPQVDAFAKALPSNRAIAADSSLKSLHASAHRGLCTLHRSIAAAGALPEARKIFAEAIRAAAAFS